ncbi:NAD(P)H-hydrate dehydratase [uncultured Planktosalinus sp.]|uniref:NAD(P)H-hydrate dehydratase n=1 Tax=uncultured Planktosalinus sp. TaxID=1810935 RepID=UPI0030DA6CD6
MKVFTAKQLKEADRTTEENEGIAPIDLMERAAGYVFQWIDNQLKGQQLPIYIFCGIGNNGGDGLAVGRMLLNKGYDVHSFIVNYSENRSKCFLINYDRYKNTTKNWPKFIKSPSDFPEIPPQALLVDALFGIGLNRPLDTWVKELVLHINQSKVFTLAVDVPSGMFIDTATTDLEAVIKASVTLTFQAPKLPFFLPETSPFSNSIQVLDIGLDRKYLTETPTKALLITRETAQKMYQTRHKFSHKGTFGHALILGGSYGKMGAVTLAVKAGLRTGAGKLTAYVPACGYEILQIAVPEAMVITDAERDKHIQFTVVDAYNVIGVGVGLGTDKTTERGFEAFLKSNNTPLVVDADGLNLLSANKELLKLIPKNSVLTPHPGELERLVGNWKNDFEKLEKTKALSKTIDGIVVIKGAHTITIYHDNLYINTTGNPGMATAGSGDVLTGIICGLLAQGYDALKAACFGVYLHGSAGDLASQHQGFNAMIAGDLIDFLGHAYIKLFQKEEVQATNSKSGNKEANN